MEVGHEEEEEVEAGEGRLRQAGGGRRWGEVGSDEFVFLVFPTKK